MIKAVIFDRDGVLVDSEGINVMSAEKAMLTFGIQIDDEDKQHILGNHPRNYGPYLRTRYVFDLPKFREIQLQMYYDLFDETPVFPEAIALLKVLKEAGFRLALNTGGDIEANTRLFAREHLDGIFEVVVTSEMFTNLKPDPESYLAVAHMLGLQPNACVAIEDTPRGLAAAKAAGMGCIVIPNSYTKHGDFSQADSVVSSATDVTIEMIHALG